MTPPTMPPMLGVDSVAPVVVCEEAVEGGAVDENEVVGLVPGGTEVIWVVGASLDVVGEVGKTVVGTTVK